MLPLQPVQKLHSVLRFKKPNELEGLVRVMGQRGVVSLEHRDVVALPGQREGAAEPTDPGSDDHNPHRTELALWPAGC